jgi:CRISPR-associated endonuclease Cas1
LILAEPLNTLFVTLPGASLGKDHQNLVVRVENEERLRVPLHHVGSVVLFGATFMSVAAMAELADRGIQISFLSEGGRFLGRVEGRWQGGSLVRKAQFLAAGSEEASLRIARGVVLGKLANSRQMLEPRPVWWTPEKRRRCLEESTWRSERDGSSRRSTRRRWCGWPGMEARRSAKYRVTWI